jgi:hypothetical protein
MKLLGIIILAAGLLAIGPGYARAQQSGQKGTPPATQPQSPAGKAEPAGAAKSYTPAERKAYEQKTAEELDQMQQKIYDLRIKSRTGPPQNKRMILRAANNLQIQTLAARNQLKELEKAPEKTWNGVRANLDKTLVDLRKTWEATEVHTK